MRTQIKFVVDAGLAEQFKQAVLRRRGKLDLSREGARALHLYLREQTAARPSSKPDPILAVIGIAASKRPVNALVDERRLYEED